MGARAPAPSATHPRTSMCTHRHTFSISKFPKLPFLGLFRGPKTKSRKNTLKLARYTPQAIHILFGVQTSGANRITPRNKYVHTQAHMLDVEISAKIAIFEGFRGPNFSLLKIMLEHAHFMLNAAVGSKPCRLFFRRKRT